MKKNFTLNQISIKFNGYSLDLHNIYDFSGLEINNEKTVRLIFSINSNFEVDEYKAKKVVIEFIYVDYFRLSDNFVEKITPNLDEIGYKNPDDLDLMWLISEAKSAKKDHIIFRFENGEFVRIHSRWASVNINSKI